MQIKILFEDNDNMQEIGIASNLREANKIMNTKIQEMNFKSYYIRVNFEQPQRIWIDYGSHTHFFVFELNNSNKSFEVLYAEENMLQKLETILAIHINPQLYCIGGCIEESFCLETQDDGFVTYLFEKGHKHDEIFHTSVSSACHQMIHTLSENEEEENIMLHQLAE